MANKPTGLQKANQKRKNVKFGKNFPQKLAAGKRMGKIKAAHEAMANPEASAANQKAVESKLAKAKSLHEGLTGKSTSAGVKSEPQSTGLNVESKPKSQSQSIQEKQEAKLAERVKSYRDEAKKPKKMSLPTVQKGHGAGSVAPVKRGASYGGVRSAAPVSANPPHIQKDINKREEAQDYAKYQSAQPHTPAPAFGARQSSASPAGPYQKNIKDTSKSDAWKHYKDMTSRAGHKFEEVGKIKDAPYKDPNPRMKTKAEVEKQWAEMKERRLGKSQQPKESSKAAPKSQAAEGPKKPGVMSKVGGAIKSAATHPTTTGFLKATGVHLGMAAMHGSNYPQKMHEYASRGPREFRPGWHGFTSPVEKPHAGEATDTKEERA